MARWTSAVLAAAALALGIAGCGRDQGTTIAVIPKADTFTFWPAVHRGADAAGEELGVNIVWRGAKDETSPTDQIKIVEAMIARRVDGIVLAPQHANSLVDVVEQAVEKGIPVVIIDSGLNSDKYVSFVATDNYQGGVMGAERLAKIIGEEGEVALIRNIPGAASTEAREKGFLDTIEKHYPEIEVVEEQHAMGTSTEAQTKVKNILKSHPGLEGIFTANEPGAIGAVNAVENAELVGKVKIVGFDASEDLIKALRSGTLDSTIVQAPYEMGYQGVHLLCKHLQGEEVEEKVNTPIKLVTQQNLDSEEIQQHLAAYRPDAKAR
ncbi:MAG: substrate-binding domain-containing protein [Candidatus Brocadiia bacterium]